MDKRTIAKSYYELNKRALDFRNSKEYFIGDRIVRYLKMLKGLHFILFAKLLLEDIWRVTFKKKTNPIVQNLDFSEEYQGKKIAVYTSVYGGYDKIVEPLYKDPNCDYYIFTDQVVDASSIWKKIEYDHFPQEINSNFLKNRYVKMLPHKVLPNYEYTVYIDGNLQITSEISLLFKNFDSPTGIAMHKHPSNNGIYEEVMYNKKLGKITEEEASTLEKLYKDNHMPAHFGMFECNVICRNSSNPKCTQIMNEWWNEVFKGVKRDQLYFTYVLFLLGYEFKDIKLIGNNINANPMFIRYQHK